MEEKTLTLGDIFLLNQPITDLINMEPAPPVRAGIKIARLARTLAEEYNLINTERNKLIQKHGEPVEGGGVSVSEKSDAWAEFAKELQELFEQQTTIKFEKVSLPPSLVVPAKTIVALVDFLEVEEERE